MTPLLLTVLLATSAPDALRVEVPATPVVLEVGHAKPRRVTVRVVDSTGRPMPGARVAWTLPVAGPTGQLDAGAPAFALTNRRGEVQVRVRANGRPGDWQLALEASQGTEIAHGLAPMRNTLAEPKRRSTSMGIFVVLIGALSLITTLAAL